MRTTVGLRFLYGYMNYDKQPINIDKQLALLQDRGLIIEDVAIAKLQLRNISYAPYYIWSKLLLLGWTLKVLYSNSLQSTLM